MKQTKSLVSGKNKFNNKGLTLVELLVTITILAIVIVPLLHSFVTSARLNNKSKDKMKTTVIAENIMEEFEDISIEELAEEKGVYPDVDGKYTFYYNAADLTEWQSDDFGAIVTLDPSGSYTAYNKEVVSEVNAITSTRSAVYSMEPAQDQSVYSIFASRSTAAHVEDSSYQEKGIGFFEQNLDRTISIRITREGTDTNDEGEIIELVKVTMVIKYQYNMNSITKALKNTDISYTITKELFDNSKTITALENIYLMYTPRYKACTNGKVDQIEILNKENVSANLYVIRQASVDPAIDTANLPGYLSGRKGVISVIEEPAWVGAYTTATPGKLSLRTNLTKYDSVTGKDILACKLTFRNAANTQSANITTSGVILSTRTADGKLLDGIASKNRIYKMKVEVYRMGESSPLTVLEGTKTN